MLNANMSKIALRDVRLLREFVLDKLINDMLVDSFSKNRLIISIIYNTTIAPRFEGQFWAHN